MIIDVSVVQEVGGRWVAEVAELPAPMPGVLVYEATPRRAVDKARATALHALADCIEAGEVQAEGLIVSFGGGRGLGVP